MTPASALLLALAAVSAREEGIHLSLTPSIEIGGGYDSNILIPPFMTRRRGAFNTVSPHFDFDLNLARRLSFDTHYELLYTNYSGGVFSSLDNFVSAGVSLDLLEFLTLRLTGQWENLDPFNRPEFSFTRLTALPSLEAGWRGIVARAAAYYSYDVFPGRQVAAPGVPVENQSDTVMEYLFLLGYTLRSSTVLTMTYSYASIRSNFLLSGRRALNSYGHTAALNIWQALWRRSRLNLRCEAVTADYTDSPDMPPREDMGYKASLIVRQGIVVHLEGFMSASFLHQGSNNPAEEFERWYFFLGIKVLFDPVRADRLWREDF